MGNIIKKSLFALCAILTFTIYSFIEPAQKDYINHYLPTSSLIRQRYNAEQKAWKKKQRQRNRKRWYALFTKKTDEPKNEILSACLDLNSLFDDFAIEKNEPKQENFGDVVLRRGAAEAILLKVLVPILMHTVFSDTGRPHRDPMKDAIKTILYDANEDALEKEYALVKAAAVQIETESEKRRLQRKARREKIRTALAVMAHIII